MNGQLADRSVIAIAGAGADNFLQGLVTADVQEATADRAGYGALLTAQGKILFDVFIHRHGADWLIDCATEQRDAFIAKLKFYRLRAKLEIAAREDLAVHVGSDGGSVDPRYAAMGTRYIAPPGVACDMAAYHARRIERGLADSAADLGSGEFYPHEANLDQLNGVSFSKGCYVGQEVVSRIEHRGSARSRILPVECESPAPAKGAEVMAGDRPIGTMLSSAGRKALAILRLDRLKDALDAGQRPMADGQAVQVIKPAWARYDVPGAKEN